MSNRLFGNILALLLIPAIMACSLFTPAPKPAQADIEKEEQAVYAFFVSGGNGPALILQTTSTSIMEEDSKKMMETIRDGLPGISNSTIENFVERNGQSSQLSADMQLGVDYVLLTENELASITSQPNWHEILQERYPGSGGYLIFSRVGFNAALDQAVVYVGQVAGPMMGSGSYYLLEKQSGEWVIKGQTMIWIS